MMLFFLFSNSSNWVLACDNDAWTAWLTSASSWTDAGWASAMAPTSNNRPNALVLWYFWHITLVFHITCVWTGRPALICFSPVQLCSRRQCFCIPLIWRYIRAQLLHCNLLWNTGKWGNGWDAALGYMISSWTAAYACNNTSL
jgi:hypothetical protein